MERDNQNFLISEAEKMAQEGASDKEIIAYIMQQKHLSPEDQERVSRNMNNYSILYNIAFSDDRTKIEGNFVKLKSKEGKFDKRIEIPNFYKAIGDMLNGTYERYRRLNSQNSKDNKNEEVVQFITIVILSERAKMKYEANTEGYKTFSKNIDKILEDLKSTVDEDTFFELIALIFLNDDSLKKYIKTNFSINGINDSDVIYICEHFLGEELFKKFWIGYCDTLLNRKEVIKKLEDIGYLTPKEYRNHACGNAVLTEYKNGKKYLLKYLSTREYFEGYLDGTIKGKELARYTKIEDLLFSGLHKDDMMKILEKKVYNNSASSIIWEQFDKGFWTADEVRTLAKLNYIYPASIIQMYRDEQKKKISAALGSIPTIREQRILEFFTPEYVLQQELISKLSDDVKTFYRNELKFIYSSQGKDLEQDIVSCVKMQNEEKPDKKDDTLISLYESGLVSADRLRGSEISEDKMIKYYKDHKSDEKIFIEFYNNGLLSGDVVLEEFGEDTEHVLDMIENLGLDASAIQGWFSTKELIDYLKNGNISGANLAKIKQDIKLPDLEKLYLEEKSLNFSELYGLVEDGVIAKEDADAINEQYDLQAALDELRKKGIRSKKIAGDDNQTTVKPKNIQPNKKKKTSNKEAKGLSPELQELFFDELGGSADTIEFNEDHPFYGCILIPIIDKKVAIIEGNSRTCVLPLKIAIEYVENSGSAEDIFGNATCRKDVYNNKKYISSLNHTKRWGNNVLDAIRDRSTVMTKEDFNKLKEDLQPLLKELEQSYVQRNGKRRE